MKTLKLVWQNNPLLKKILFTLAAFALYRVAVFIPVPLITIPEQFFDNDLLGIFNALGGGAFKTYSVVFQSIGADI